jgi:hypothetical protein
MNRVLEEVDVWRPARELMALHGDAARSIASQRVDALRAENDLRFLTWRKILFAIEWMELQRSGHIPETARPPQGINRMYLHAVIRARRKTGELPP